MHTGQNAQGVVRGLETEVGDREAAREAQDQRRGRRALTSWRNKKELSKNSLIVRSKGPLETQRSRVGCGQELLNYYFGFLLTFCIFVMFGNVSISY